MGVLHGVCHCEDVLGKQCEPNHEAYSQCHGLLSTRLESVLSPTANCDLFKVEIPSSSLNL